MEPSLVQTQFFSVWAIPPNEVADRLKKVMEGLRSEFGGPQFQPHVTFVRAISLTKQDALDKFSAACEGLKAYNTQLDRVFVDSHCLHLTVHSTPQVVEASGHCRGHFGFKTDTPYWPHLSLLYTELTMENQIKAKEKVNCLDESINSLTFPVNCIQLWTTDPEDTNSWGKVAEFTLGSN